MMSRQRLRASLKAYPLAVDVTFAAMIFVITLTTRHPDTVPGQPAPFTAVLLPALAGLALAGRRRLPRTTLAVVAATVGAAMLYAQGRPIFTIAVAVAVYTVAVRTDRRTTVVASAATAALLAAAMVIEPTGGRLQSVVDLVTTLLGWVGVAAAVGDAVRSRRAYIAAIEERAVRAERTRDEEARRQVAEERLRIARELHDVVAHHVAVVSVQAGAAEHLIVKQPQRAREALLLVQRASAAILEELTGILGVLRHTGEPTPHDACAPSLHQLDALIASYAAAGMHVTWSLSGQTRAVADTVDLVAYRVVQEALTNAHKHGTGTAEVAVRYTPSTVTLEVSNPMRGPEPNRHRPGHGLIGMRERASAVGGALRVGFGPRGTFTVTASLPVQGEES